jgi:hypothetical protein
MLFPHFECLQNYPHHEEASEKERFVLSARVVLSTTADPSKLEPYTSNHNAAIDIEGAKSLMSLHLQQQAATSVNDTEEDLENVQA